MRNKIKGGGVVNINKYKTESYLSIKGFKSNAFFSQLIYRSLVFILLSFCGFQEGSAVHSYILIVCVGEMASNQKQKRLNF